MIHGDGDRYFDSGKDSAMTTPTLAPLMRSLVAVLAASVQTAARSLWHQAESRRGTGSRSKRRARVVAGAAMAAAGLTAVSLMAVPAQAVGGQLDIARGVVTYNGSPVSGATVHAYLWPNGPTLVGEADGAEVPIFELNATTTDVTGHYYVSMASPGSIPAMYQETDGSVSVEVDVISGGRYMTTSDSVTYSSTAGVWKDAETGVSVASGSGQALDFGAGTSQNTYKFDEGGNTLDSAAMTYQGDATTTAAGAGTCTWSAGAMHYGRPEHFMNVNSWTGAKGRVAESSSSTHTLGIGVTSDGFSTLKAGGTVTVALSSNSETTVSASGLVDQSLGNKVNDRDFSLVCPLGPTGDGRRRPVSTYMFLDGSLQHGISHTYYFSSCGQLKAGQTFHTTTAHQATIAHGFDLGPINVSAQSGFGNSVQLSFTATKDGFVCGSSDAGPVNSGKLDSRSFK